MRLTRLLIVTLISVLCLNAVTALLPKATAATGFQAGRIIDDNVFYNGNDLTSGSIQGFLNSKVPTCDTNGTKAYGGTTRAAYGASKGHPAPFTCLKDYRQDTPNRPAETGLCNSYTGGNKSAAEIIQDVARACGINQKVLVVLLEKEQSLVTDDWPWSTQYESATGFGCPDTAPCDPQFGAFFDQIYYAARQFKRYARDASLFNYRVGRNAYIQYNPNAGCGGTNVFLQNQATASLYNYTPYQPNQAALNNVLGLGDACSAYGNRNFWRLFSDWFGATTSESDADTLSFIRLNHSSGKVEDLGLSSIGSYAYISRSSLVAYPSVAGDGNVVPTYWLNGDLVFLRLNHGSGHVELVSLSTSSGYQQLINYKLTGYPAVAGDGNVVPMFNPVNGDLTFIRLNHPSGKVELVSYSASSGYQKLSNYKLVAYPAVAGDGNVVPMYWLNGDLVFLRLNHGSGHVELVSLSASSGYQQLANYQLTGYPAVAGDGNVVPFIKPSGDLSFVRLNHTSGSVEAISYSARSGFQQVSDYKLTGYPAVAGDGNVVPLYSR